MANMQNVVAIMDGVLNLWTSMGGDLPAAQSMAKDGLLNITKSIEEQSSIAFQDAAAVNNKITDMTCWSQGQRDDLKSLLSSKVNLTQPTSLKSDATHCGRRKQQDYTSFPYYCTDEIWDLLLDNGVEWENKIIVASKLAAALGMRCPTELSCAVVMTMSLLDSMSERGKFEDQSMYDLLQESKRKIKDACDNHFAVHEYVQVLPQSPDDFKSSPWYGEAFADGKHPAAMMKVHFGTIMSFARKIPLRTTRSTVQPRRLNSHGALQDNNGMTTMMNMMMQFMQGQQQQPPQQRNNRAHCSLSAILNGGCRSDGRAGAGGGRSEQLAIEDANDEERKKLALERQQLQKEKAELEKLKVDADLSKEIHDDDLPGDDAAAETSLAEAPPKNESVAEGVRRLKQFMSSSAGEAKVASNLKARPAAAPSKQREAGVKNDKKKKVEKGKNVKKVVKKQVVPSHLTKRYPEGCSKCRWKPGCTPSCFRYRNQL